MLRQKNADIYCSVSYTGYDTVEFLYVICGEEQERNELQNKIYYTIEKNKNKAFFIQ